MYMKMRNTLAHTIIDGHECALRLHPLHDGSREKPDIGKQRANQGVRQIEKRLDVAPGDEERVAGKKRAMIQEGERNIVFKDLEARYGTANDIAEKAAFLEYFTEMGLGNGLIFHLIFYLGISLE